MIVFLYYEMLLLYFVWCYKIKGSEFRFMISLCGWMNGNNYQFGLINWENTLIFGNYESYSIKEWSVSQRILIQWSLKLNQQVRTELETNLHNSGSRQTQVKEFYLPKQTNRQVQETDIRAHRGQESDQYCVPLETQSNEKTLLSKTDQPRKQQSLQKLTSVSEK